MKVDQLLEQLQAGRAPGVVLKGPSNTNGSEGKRLKEEPSGQEPSYHAVGSSDTSEPLAAMANFSFPWLLHGLLSTQNYGTTTGSPAPLSSAASSKPEPIQPILLGAKEAAQGILAVGGCRQCAKTFTDRLELIHHFVDHFPAIFYSFEPLTRLPVGESKSTHTQPPKSQGVNELQKQFASLINQLPPTPQFDSPKIGGPNFPDLISLLAVNGGNLSHEGPAEIHRRAKLGKASGTANTESKLSMAAVDHISLDRRPSPQVTHVEKGNAEGKAAGLKNRVLMSGSESGMDHDLPYHMCPHCCLTFSGRISS
jgi:hypothetical protein